MLSAFLHVVSALLGKIVLNRWNKWDDSRITKEQEAHEYEKSVVIAKNCGHRWRSLFHSAFGIRHSRPGDLGR